MRFFSATADKSSTWDKSSTADKSSTWDKSSAWDKSAKSADQNDSGSKLICKITLMPAGRGLCIKRLSEGEIMDQVGICRDFELIR